MVVGGSWSYSGSSSTGESLEDLERLRAGVEEEARGGESADLRFFLFVRTGEFGGVGGCIFFVLCVTNGASGEVGKRRARV